MHIMSKEQTKKSVIETQIPSGLPILTEEEELWIRGTKAYEAQVQVQRIERRRGSTASAMSSFNSELTPRSQRSYRSPLTPISVVREDVEDSRDPLPPLPPPFEPPVPSKSKQRDPIDEVRQGCEPPKETQRQPPKTPSSRSGSDRSFQEMSRSEDATPKTEEETPNTEEEAPEGESWAHD
jgi:hypothetical protein